MSLKQIIILLVFSLLSVYMAFLNPHEVEVFLTQSYSLHLPMVILLLGFILVGVVLTVVMELANRIKTSFSNFQASMKRKENERKTQWCEAQFEKGEYALTGGNLGKAKEQFEKILEEFPNHVGALNSLGKVLLKQGDVERALEIHQKGAQVAPGNVKILYSLADDYAAAGKPVKEIQVLNKIRNIDSNSPKVLFRLRDWYLENKDWGEAAELQKRVLTLIKNPQELEREHERYSQLLYSHAVSNWEQGKLDTAIVEFKKALKNDEKCLPAYITLGDIHLKAGNPKAALKTWLAGFDWTRSPVCLLRVQKIYQTPEERQSMVNLYRDAIQNASDSKEKDTLVMLLVTVLLEDGEADQTIKTLEDHPLESTLYHQVMLEQAHQLKKDTTQSERASKQAYSRVRDMIIEHTYNRALKSFKEWDSYFPEYKSWDTFKRGAPQPVLTQGGMEKEATAATT